MPPFISWLLTQNLCNEQHHRTWLPADTTPPLKWMHLYWFMAAKELPQHTQGIPTSPEKRYSADNAFPMSSLYSHRSHALVEQDSSPPQLPILSQLLYQVPKCLVLAMEGLPWKGTEPNLAWTDPICTKGNLDGICEQSLRERNKIIPHMLTDWNGSYGDHGQTKNKPFWLNSANSFWQQTASIKQTFKNP